MAGLYRSLNSSDHHRGIPDVLRDFSVILTKKVRFLLRRSQRRLILRIQSSCTTLKLNCDFDSSHGGRNFRKLLRNKMVLNAEGHFPYMRSHPCASHDRGSGVESSYRTCCPARSKKTNNPIAARHLLFYTRRSLTDSVR